MNQKIFISYRRETGGELAKSIHDRLEKKKYKCFFDLKSIKAGDFQQKILSEMDQCDIFLLVISKNALDRCIDPADYVRLEIEAALERNLTIIPILVETKKFPENLPPSIDRIRKENALTYYLQYAEAFYPKLYSFIDEKRGRKKVPVIPCLIGLAIIILAAVLLLYRPLFHDQKEASGLSAGTASETGLPETDTALSVQTESGDAQSAAEADDIQGETAESSAVADSQSGQILPDDFLLHMEELSRAKLSTVAEDNEYLTLHTDKGEIDISPSFITISDETLSKKAVFYETGGVTGFFLCYDAYVQIDESWDGFLGPLSPDSEYPDAAIVFKLDTGASKLLDQDRNLRYTDDMLEIDKIYESREAFETDLQENLQFVDCQYYEIDLP